MALNLKSVGKMLERLGLKLEKEAKHHKAPKHRAKKRNKKKR